MTADGASTLRQVVLLTDDLDATVADVRDRLGLHRGVRDDDGMAAVGFAHEVLAIDQTFIEIVTPLAADSSSGRLLTRRGPCGYMVVVQVPSLDAVCERASTLGIAPILRSTYDGAPISQWHPRDLGTLAEFDEVAPGAPWHLCPALSDTGSTAVADDIGAVVIAVPDPAASARTWAVLLDLAPVDATTLDVGGRRVVFVAGDGGLVGVDLDAADGGSLDVELCGVRFRHAGSATTGDA